MQCKGVAAYMREHTRLTEKELHSEIIRYACEPGQAAGYYVGLSVFRAIAEKVGPESVGHMHRRVLLHGSVPLRMLVREWLL